MSTALTLAINVLDTSMGQRQPLSAAGDQAWLSELVDTFERTEQLSYESCDPALLVALKARLDRPASSGGRLAKTRCS